MQAQSVIFHEWDDIKVTPPIREKETKTQKVYNNKMYSIIYRLRKHLINIDTTERTIYYSDSEEMKRKGVKRLCSEFGFVRQSKF